MKSLPESNNYYSLFKGCTAEEVIQILVKSGWASRKSGWNEFELSDDLSELELSSTKDGVLLNGRITNLSKYIEIVQLFKDVGLDFSAELYNDDTTLLRSDNNIENTNT